MLFAGTGDGYLCIQLASFSPISKRKVGEDVHTYMNTTYLQGVINHLRVLGMVHKDEQRLCGSEEKTVNLLIGVDGCLYELAATTKDISILPINLPYAVGCGGSIAWGSLLTTQNSELTAVERLSTALNIAAMVSGGCDSNIDILEE